MPAHVHMCEHRDGIFEQERALNPTPDVQDVLERAQTSLAAGRTKEAVRHYHLGEEVIRDALALDVPSFGLGPAFSNTASWQADLLAWLRHIHHRSIFSLVIWTPV